MKSRFKLTLISGGLAGFVSAIPSTAYFLVTGGDFLEPLNALAATAGANGLPVFFRVIVAGAIHFIVSFLWAGVLVVSIPKRFGIPGAMIASVIIALFDLKVIAPQYFPGLSALAFTPQLIDHIVWGFVVGIVLRLSRS
jgi:energy-converting hydrogenase Eha subunit B